MCSSQTRRLRAGGIFSLFSELMQARHLAFSIYFTFDSSGRTVRALKRCQDTAIEKANTKSQPEESEQGLPKTCARSLKKRKETQENIDCLQDYVKMYNAQTSSSGGYAKVGASNEEVKTDAKSTKLSLHASQFAVLCMDGSYPLHWTQLHKDYKELFDQQLEAILWFQDSSKAEFLELCSSTMSACEGLHEEALAEFIETIRLRSIGSRAAVYLYETLSSALCRAQRCLFEGFTSTWASDGQDCPGGQFARLFGIVPRQWRHGLKLDRAQVLLCAISVTATKFRSAPLHEESPSHKEIFENQSGSVAAIASTLCILATLFSLILAALVVCVILLDRALSWKHQATYYACRRQVQRVQEALMKGKDNLSLCPCCVECTLNTQAPKKVKFLCGHGYHLDCINSWFQENPQSVGCCPVCEVGKLQQETRRTRRKETTERWAGCNAELWLTELACPRYSSIFKKFWGK
eukprot:g1925.t1